MEIPVSPVSEAVSSRDVKCPPSGLDEDEGRSTGDLYVANEPGDTSRMATRK